MVGKLDHEVIEKFKEFQEKTGNHRELYIEDVEFEEVSLKELHQKDKVTIKKTTTADKFIEIGDIDRATKKYDISKKIKNNLPDKGKHAPKGTILISRVRPLLGGYTIIDGDDYTFTSGDLNPIVLPKNISEKYIFKIICSPKFETFLRNNQNTAGQKPTITSELYNFSVPIPKDLNKFYPSCKIQEAIVEFLEFWKSYTDSFRNRVAKKKPIYESIKKLVVKNTFKYDKFLVERFDSFAKGSGYGIRFNDIRFNECDLFNDEGNVTLIGSKKIGTHEELKKVNDKNGIPVYDASPNILTYIDKTKYPNEVFNVEDYKNPDISFASEGNSSAGTNFIIHSDSYYINNHRTVIKFSNKYYGKYIYYNIYKMKEKYGFKRGYIPSQQELKRLKIIVYIPKTKSKKYNSFELQNILVEFWEIIMEQIDKQLDIYKRMSEVSNMINKAFLYRTFSKIDWSKQDD